MADHGQDLGGAPLGFNREEERQVVETVEHSLFCVLIQLRRPDVDEDEYDEQAKMKYSKVGQDVRTAEKRTPRGDIAIPYNSGERTSTGFAVATNGNMLRILTCAHAISDIYSKDKHNKLTLVEINKIFKFGVHCVHQELGIRTMDSNLIISDRKRNSTLATVVAIDTDLDLLVLEVEVGEVWRGLDEEGYQIACKADHPVIHFANENPINLQKLVLAGWPPQRSGASVTGQVSHNDWTCDAVTALNTKGHTMRLLEIPGMAGDCGFSGALVLNGAGRCVGVYHGVFNLINGYAISLMDVTIFLEAHDMFHWEPAP